MEIAYHNIKTIGFDADDTLWLNETYFRAIGHEFAQMPVAYQTESTIDQELFKTEIKNLPLYLATIKEILTYL